MKVPANGNVPVYWTYKAGKKGITDLLMSAKCDAGSDASLKKLPVVAAAIMPSASPRRGLVGKGDLKLSLPEDFDPKPARGDASRSRRRSRPTSRTRCRTSSSTPTGASSRR